MQYLKGSAASIGIKEGKACVLKSIDEFNKFHQGDILVTVATSPAWTPLIFAASAVVTDVGGILCHAAIVSREYGIPAVVGTKDATRIIKNGQTVRVDGNKGIVELIE